MEHLKTILVAEDNESEALLLRHAFASAGIDINLRVVADGDAALAYLAAKTSHRARSKHPVPTLVLLDLKMPGTDGFEVLSWVRQQPRLKRLLVVILTASSE